MQFRVNSQVVGGLYPGGWGVELEIKKKIIIIIIIHTYIHT